jgi:hypothetical protein
MNTPFSPFSGWYNEEETMSYPKEVNTLFTVLFWKDLAERVVATVAQVLLGLLTADGATSVPASVWVTTTLVAAAAVVLKAVVAVTLVKGDDSVSPASLATSSPKDLL